MKEKLQDIIRSFVSGTHLFLVDMQVKGPVVEISLDGDCGVSINECAALNRFIHKNLEEADINIGDYTVEVSSPGFDRPLSSIREYKKNTGRKLQIRNNQNRIITGLLTYVDDNKIVLTGGGKNRLPEEIAMKAIKEAKTVI